MLSGIPHAESSPVGSVSGPLNRSARQATLRRQGLHPDVVRQQQAMLPPPLITLVLDQHESVFQEAFLDGSSHFIAAARAFDFAVTENRLTPEIVHALLPHLRDIRSFDEVCNAIDLASQRLGRRVYQELYRTVADSAPIPQSALRTVVSDPNASDEQLRAAALNPAASAELLHNILEHPHAGEAAYAAIAQHPRVDMATMERLLQGICRNRIRPSVYAYELGRAIAYNTSVPAEVVLAFARDPHAKPYLVGLGSNSQWPELVSELLRNPTVTTDDLRAVFDEHPIHSHAFMVELIEHECMTSALLCHLMKNAYQRDLHSYFEDHPRANLETAAALNSETYLVDPMQLSSLVSRAVAHSDSARRWLASPAIDRHTGRGLSARTLRALSALMLEDPRLPNSLVPVIMNSPGSGDSTVKNAVESMSNAGNVEELRAIIFDEDASPRALAAISARILQEAPRLNRLQRTA